jgi:hypothetical protein
MEATKNFFKTVSDATESGSRQASSVVGQASSAVGQALGELGDSVESCLSSARRAFNKPRGLQEWVIQQASVGGDQQLKAWLEDMPGEDWRALNKAILDFSANLNFRPEWFWEPDLAKDLPLENVLRGALMTFVEAYYQAHKVQADINIFNNWLGWTKNPGKHLAQTRQLFAALYRQQRVVVTDDFITMSEKERDSFMVEAIRKARAADGVAFLDVFKQTFSPAVVVEPAPAAEIPAEEPTVIENASDPVEFTAPDAEPTVKRSSKSKTQE